MKIAMNHRLLTAVVALTGTALFTLVLHDTATTHAAMRQQATRSLAQSGKTISEGDAVAYVTGAPYRDGLFQGKLARERRSRTYFRWPLVISAGSHRAF